MNENRIKSVCDACASILRVIICIVALYAIMRGQETNVELAQERIKLMNFINVAQPVIEQGLAQEQLPAIPIEIKEGVDNGN